MCSSQYDDRSETFEQAAKIVAKTWPNPLQPHYDEKTVALEHLCNFPQWMPGGTFRQGRYSGFHTMTFEQLIDDIDRTEYSPKFLSKTRAEVIADVDAACRAVEIPETSIKSFVTLSIGTSILGQETALEKELFKVYEYLRKSGYYQKELVS